jgi:hypothetical protein
MVWFPTRDLKHYAILYKADQDLSLFEEKLKKFNLIEHSEEDAKLLNDMLADIIDDLSKLKVETFDQREKRIRENRS